MRLFLLPSCPFLLDVTLRGCGATMLSAAEKKRCSDNDDPITFSLGRGAFTMTRMEPRLRELRALAARAENHRTETGIPGVAMVQGAIPEHRLTGVYEPMINLILQGSKTMSIGGRTLDYDPATYFVMTVDLPAVGTVRPARSGAPYLAVSLTLDRTRLSSLLRDLPTPPPGPAEHSAFSVAAVTPALLDAWLRMLRLMTTPEDIPALAPAYEREILYRVLQGPLGWLLRDIATPDTTLGRINRAIHEIRQRYASPLRIDELADKAAMSVSAFHRRFKAVTALSPLQYQKQLRLLQARTLLLAGRHSVSSVAHRVGYASATQFSREYARRFGLPPAQDVARMIVEDKAAGRLGRQRSNV